MSVIHRWECAAGRARVTTAAAAPFRDPDPAGRAYERGHAHGRTGMAWACPPGADMLSYERGWQRGREQRRYEQILAERRLATDAVR